MKATFKVHRVNRGLSIEDAAEKIGIDVDRLRKIEAYELEVTPQEIKAICELYEIEFLNEIIFYNKEQKLNYIKKRQMYILMKYLKDITCNYGLSVIDESVWKPSEEFLIKSLTERNKE